MDRPIVSVVIPAFNQASFLGHAIRSVLAQRYAGFEIIVVNDASPDHTSSVVASFGDHRVRLVEHERNLGLPAARNTGMRLASGALVAFLDADDLFTPDKLAAHVAFLQCAPDVAATYNARFELNHSEMTTREVWNPPARVDLTDLVLGFPFAPSDMVVRRQVAEAVGFFDEDARWGAEDLDFPCRLALAGHRIVRVPGVLTCRRRHSGRRRQHLDRRIQDYERVLERVFADTRCPSYVRAMQPAALSERLLEVGCEALEQEATDLGRSCLARAARLTPEILAGNPCRFARYLMTRAIADEGENHDVVIRRVLMQLPRAYGPVLLQSDWMVRHGYLHRGARVSIWGEKTAERHFQRAGHLGTGVDRAFLGHCVQHLVNVMSALGAEALDGAVTRLKLGLAHVATSSDIRWVEGALHANLCFESYRAGRYGAALRHAGRAIGRERTLLLNRGILSVIARSAYRQGFRQVRPGQ